MSAPDLPRTGLAFVRRIRDAAPAELPVSSARDLIARHVLSAALWRLDDDGRVEGQRRDTLGPQWHLLTAEWVRDTCKELGLGGDPSDAYAPRLTDDAATAAEVAAEVEALVRAVPTGTPMLPTLSPAAALARQLVRTRELVPDGDRLRWRLRYADPALGGAGPMPPPPEPSGGRAPAGLRAWGSRAPERDPGDLVTAGEIEHVVRTGGFLSSHAAAPAWADVLTELRVLAGLPAAPSAPAGDAGPTGWLRRRATRP